jgi:hypothetical protein
MITHSAIASRNSIRTRRLLSTFICSLPFLIQSAALRRIPYKVKFQF